MNQNNILIESLQHCVTACQHCAGACLEEDETNSLTDCIKLDLDCADLCGTAARLLSRGSGTFIPLIELCRDLCAECAGECEKHDHDHCEACAKACRRCEEQCRNYLNQ